MKRVIETVSGLTEMERRCFNHFEFNYSDLEANLEDNANYVDFLDCQEDIPAKQLRGVFSSLEKKGLIVFAYCDKTTFYITGLAVACWFYMNEKANYDKCSKKILEQYI